MKYVYLDRSTIDGKPMFSVSWNTINGIKRKHFAIREVAERDAANRMGMTGAIISTLDMSPEQIQEHNEKQARFADMARNWEREGRNG